MVNFTFIRILIEHFVSELWRPDQTPRYALSGLGWHCLPMIHKQNDRLIWVKFSIEILIHIKLRTQFLIHWEESVINLIQKVLPNKNVNLRVRNRKINFLSLNQNMCCMY